MFAEQALPVVAGHRIDPADRQRAEAALEQVDVTAGAHRHVQPAVAARLLDGDLVSQRREVGIEHARVVALVVGDVVVRPPTLSGGIPLVRDAREERMEQFLQAPSPPPHRRSHAAIGAIMTGRRAA